MAAAITPMLILCYSFLKDRELSGISVCGALLIIVTVKTVNYVLPILLTEELHGNMSNSGWDSTHP